MRRPLKRRLARDPDRALRSEISRWRRTASHDDQAMAVCDDLQKLLDAGWTQRVGGPDKPRVCDLRPEWGGKEPPEDP